MDLIDICRPDLATPSKGEIRSDGTVSQLLATSYVEGEAIAAAELQDGVLIPTGWVKFASGGKELRHRLRGLRAGLADLSGSFRCAAHAVASHQQQRRPRRCLAR